MVGLEQGLLPHSHSLGDRLALEKERRLCYVGITRAKSVLYLSHAAERRSFSGKPIETCPSQFIKEMPKDLVVKF